MSTTKEIVLSAALACFFLFNAAALQAQGAIEVTWVRNDTGSFPFDQWLTREIQAETGVSLETTTISVGQGRFDELFLAIERSESEKATLIMGLTREQVLFLGRELQRLAPISGSIAGPSSLTVEAENKFRLSEDGYWGVPTNLTSVVTCADERSSFFDRSQMSLDDFAYHVSRQERRVAFPDPAVDAVGRAVLLSAFVEGSGSFLGWEIVDSLDGRTERYFRSHWDSCEAVSVGDADVGFTMLGAEGYYRREFPNMNFSLLDRSMYVPTYFAAVLLPRGEAFILGERNAPVLEPDLAAVIDWLSSEGIERAITVATDQAAKQGYDVSYNIDSHETLYRFLPVSEILSDWRTRYGFKSSK